MNLGTLGRSLYYRSLAAGADYRPDASWPTERGRFDDGTRATLYTSTTQEGAVAEFYRPKAHLLALRDVVRLRLYSLDMEVSAEVLDVTTDAEARSAGIEPDRLVSNDPDEVVRYRECRDLAVEVEDNGGGGIRYPGAAHVDHPPNVVVFGQPAEERWTVHEVLEIETPPTVEAADIISYQR